MVVNYAESYKNALVQSFYDTNLRTGALWQSPSNTMFSFDGAKHIKVPKLYITSGRKNRSRGQMGTPTPNYSNDWDDYELKFDRYWDTTVDPRDVNETNNIVTIANITQQYNLQQKLPEKDRYMVSKLFKDKQALDPSGIHEENLDGTNVLDAFDSMMENMDEARVPQQNRILYITPATYRLLKAADVKNRNAMINGNGNINRSVASIEDVQVVTIPSDLMQTDFDFSNGSQLIDSAQQIPMFLIQNGVQLAPEKYSFVGLDAPAAINGGNYLYNEQEYSDVFLLKPRAAGIEFYITPNKTGKAKKSTQSSGK